MTQIQNLLVSDQYKTFSITMFEILSLRYSLSSLKKYTNLGGMIGLKKNNNNNGERQLLDVEIRCQNMKNYQSRGGNGSDWVILTLTIMGRSLI